MTQTILPAFTLDRFLVVLALALTFATGATMGVQSDTWWQLRTGQLILEQGQVPTTDPFSSTVRGGYWPNHEWLAQVCFYLLYAGGGLRLLLLGCAALVSLTWCGVYLLCDGPPRVRAGIVLLGVASQSVIWSARPHLFSLAMLVAALLLLPRRRWHWLYPPLFLVWANTHAGVAFGGAVLMAAWLVALVRDRRASLHWLFVGGLSFLATLINPLGWGLWTYVFHSLNDVTRPFLLEWQPPHLGWPASYPFFVLVLLCAASVLWARKHWRGQRDWTLLLLALLFALMGFRSIRHTAFFAIVAVPLITRPFRDIPVLTRRSSTVGVFHLVLLLALMLGATIVVRRSWAAMPTQPLPANAVAAVRDCGRSLFNTYDLGGPLIWLVPEQAVFIDNRQDPYPAELLFQAVKAEQHGSYADLFSAYQITCALVPVKQPIYMALRRDGWEAIYGDDQVAVLRR